MNAECTRATLPPWRSRTGLLRERNAIEGRIARLLDLPALNGHAGEWIAARIFDIELESAANAAGYDGRFTTGVLSGKTVNVKTYTKHDGTLDMKSRAPCDYYLVLAGPKAAVAKARGTVRPFCIRSVFLLDSVELRTDLEARGRKICDATSVLAKHWDAAEVFPRPNNPLLPLNDLQRHQLEMFAYSGV